MESIRVEMLTLVTTLLEKVRLTHQAHKSSAILMLAPIFGSLIFVALYIVATFLYPGGSQVDKDSIGFSWTNNYWCNMLNEIAINGQPNPAKPIALTGMVVLCLTLSLFWFNFPRQIPMGKTLARTIQVSGILAMAISTLLFTALHHDLVINLASLLGVIATTGTFIGLFKVKWFGLFAFGLVNIFLIGLNNLCYYNKALIVYLPAIQKITFLAFLFWVCSINIKQLGVRI